MSTLTIGIDIGSGAVKSTLFRVEDDGSATWLAKTCERIRRRDPLTLAREGMETVLARAGLDKDDIDYIATTGEGENVKFATGHFYSGACSCSRESAALWTWARSTAGRFTSTSVARFCLTR